MKKVFKKLFLIFILFNLFGTTNLMAKKEQYHPLLILEDIQVSYPKKNSCISGSVLWFFKLHKIYW